MTAPADTHRCPACGWDLTPELRALGAVGHRCVGERFVPSADAAVRAAREE